MTGPSLDLVALALQVTVPALAALALASRRDPAAASRTMACAIGVVLLMTALAFVPLPSWPALAPPEPPSPVAPPVSTTSEVPEKGTSASAAAHGIDAVAALRSLYESFRAYPHARDRALSATGIFVLSFAALGLLRLGFAWVSAWSLVSRAVPVADAALLDRVRSVAEGMGCHKSLSIRESGELAGAATVGWRRPVLLLGADWREWPESELKAALAHEVSHVARGDYFARLAANLAAALHGYHPLVRLLAARLSFAQERAADERAARSVGGRAPYFRSLAAIALRADRSIAAGGAPAFLSEPRTLLRRIAMLRVKDDTASGRWGRVAAALVLALGAAALGLRSTTPVTRAAGEAGTSTASRPARPPLDVSLTAGLDDKEARGVYAIRVGEAFRAPELARQKDAINRIFRGESTPLPGVDLRFGLPIEDVEQIAGRVYHRVEDKPPPNQSVMLSFQMVRAARDFDWLKQLHQSFGKVTERRYHGKSYYEVETSQSKLLALFGPMDRVRFYIPDERTLIFDNEANIRQLIDAATNPLPTPAWSAEWRNIEQGFVAVAIRDPLDRTSGRAKPVRIDPPITDPVQKEELERCTAFLRGTNHLVFGLDAAAGCRFELYAAMESARAASQGAEALRGILAYARRVIETDQHGDVDAVEKLLRAVAVSLLRSAVVASERETVKLKAETKSGVHEVFQAIGVALPELK